MQTPTKDQLIKDLKNSFQETIDWYNKQPEEHFNEVLVAGKWTMAGHLYHLIKTVKAVSQGMKMPKLGLRTMFGKSNRPERTYKEMVEKYETSLVKLNIKAPDSYAPKPDRTFERTALIQRFEGELVDFINVLDKWTEEDMGVYIMPHPAIGKCTMREFVYFTILHNYHHLSILKEKYTQN